MGQLILIAVHAQRAGDGFSADLAGTFLDAGNALNALGFLHERGIEFGGNA